MSLLSYKISLRAVRNTAMLVAVLFVASCGFRPMLASNAYGPGVVAHLSAITIAEVRKRVAQRVRNRLVSIMSPPGTAAAPLYRLEIFPFEKLRDTLVRRDADVQRRIYELRVTYKLFDLATNRPLNSGSVLAVASFVRVISEFANVRARREAEDRAAVAAADDIKIRLSAFFAARQ